MIKYTGKILITLQENIVGSASSPAAEHLFKVRDEKEAKCLQEEQANCFHHITAQILFLCSWALRDIQTAVAFPTKRLKKPN